MRSCRQSLKGMALVLVLAGQAWPQGYAPKVAPSKMVVADGLAVNLYAAEPDVRQPILVKCDDRGRIWTIQYLQYPNPAGLKRVKVDRYSRTVYDRVPEPPPRGPRGDDRITICADTDGDGRADRFRDFVSGLNLCTGLALGHGGVYVLQVPYLLFYADRDRDDVPDGDPEVLLSGFGMEDAQSLANHLTWGPDGWLYGVTGSTVNNQVRGLEFQQAVWRFHPLSHKFELFCEGGGNLFGLTFDADGNLFFSSNGIDLAYHGVQGAYYRKNFGKHGPLHNPHAYGFFEHLPYDQPVAGPRPGGILYLGDALPERFRGTLLCCDFLQHSVSSWRLPRRGATFAATYGGSLLESRDTWFSAPDLCQGADGAVYVCDFHDRRTAHPDPDANWDRSNGRIYRIAPRDARPVERERLDLGRMTSGELAALVRDGRRWYAEQARVALAARRDPSTWPALTVVAKNQDHPRRALQGLWCLYVSGGFDDALAGSLLSHPGEYVRAWTVRLLGDEGRVSTPLARRLVEMAASEPSVIVRCQLAATARRLSGGDGLPVVEHLLRRGLDCDDPYVPLMLWWALESRAISSTERLLAFFGDRAAWENAAIRENALRLIRRYAAEGTRAGYDGCAQLLAAAPADHQAAALAALDLGLAERAAVPGGMGMGTGGLFASIAAPENLQARPPDTRRFEPLAGALRDAIDASWRAAPAEVPRLRLALRAGVADALSAVLVEVERPATAPARRCALLGLLAEFGGAEAVPVVLGLLRGGLPIEVQSAALDALAPHGDDRVTAVLLDHYVPSPAALRGRIAEILLSRPVSALAFLERVDRHEIAAVDVPVERLRPVALHGDAKLDALVRKLWGRIEPGTPEEKLAEIRRLNNDLRAVPGDRVRGKDLFGKHCATCHKLFGTGGEIGPDLTGTARGDTPALLASIVDPGALVRAPYLQYAAVTAGGRIVSGLLVAQDGASVTLADAQNQRTTLARETIEELRDLPTSIMPDNLLKPLSPQEVRDLFAYLQGPPA
jgi:putative membrane-bound dehydrogenase-like protein